MTATLRFAWKRGRFAEAVANVELLDGNKDYHRNRARKDDGYAAVRVVIDPADRAVPPAALLAMAPGGSTDISSMVWDILARPSQLSLLLRLAADAYAARTALVRLRRALGPAFSNE